MKTYRMEKMLIIITHRKGRPHTKIRQNSTIPLLMYSDRISDSYRSCSMNSSSSLLQEKTDENACLNEQDADKCQQ